MSDLILLNVFLNNGNKNNMVVELILIVLVFGAVLLETIALRARSIIEPSAWL
jgi:hypothetical protein